MVLEMKIGLPTGVNTVAQKLTKWLHALKLPLRRPFTSPGMSAQSSLSNDEKARVKANLLGAKVLYAARARIYYVHPDSIKWSYTGLEGALAFVIDRMTGALLFKLVDLDGTRGVIWKHELDSGLQYHPDRAFSHSFAGDECMIGFVFSHKKEAKKFWKKVATRKEEESVDTRECFTHPLPAKSPKEKKKSTLNKGGKIDKSSIFAPTVGSFVHLGHMGYDEEKGFLSRGVDPSLKAFLTNLESGSVPKEVIAKNYDFIRDFVREYQEQQPIPQKEPKKPKRSPPEFRCPYIANDNKSSQAPGPLLPPLCVSPPHAPPSSAPQSSISAPVYSFVNLGHMGCDEEKGFLSRGDDRSWEAFLTNLESQGVSKKIIAKNYDFIIGFVREYQNQQLVRRKEPKKSKLSPSAPQCLYIANDNELSLTPTTPCPSGTKTIFYDDC